jgi:YbbR domain-containing protein
MLVRLVRWFSRNLGNLVLAFVMAVVVWVAAIVAADPNQESVYPRAVPLEIIGQDPGMLQLANIPSEVRITLSAPRSIWEQLVEQPDLVRAWIDLSGLGAGEHVVEVKTQIQTNPVRVVSVEPDSVPVSLEPLKSGEYEINLMVNGEPALGYRAGTPTVDPQQVIISGPESLVDQVKQAYASLDINNANATIRRDVNVQALDAAGNPVRGVDISPQLVRVTQPITLLGGYRNVIVKVLTTGEPAGGNWLTNISVNPPNVTVFSTDPQLVNELPGYVETNPIDLTGLSDDTDFRVTLNLPEGITLVGDESVLVRLSIAAQEGALPISLPIDAIGLPPDMDATFFPESVDLLLVGPLPILNNLKPAEVRVVVNLSGLEPGTYQVEPVVDLLPNQVQVASIEPETVLAGIVLSPTPTPTPTGQTTPASVVQITGTPTPEPTQTLTLTPTP